MHLRYIEFIIYWYDHVQRLFPQVFCEYIYEV